MNTMHNRGPFTTSFGRTISGYTMTKVAEELAADRDWQDVASRLLRPVVPEHEEDLEEINEVLSEAEVRVEAEATREERHDRHAVSWEAIGREIRK